MRRLIYVVGGQEVASYSKAREIQPTGELEIKLVEIPERAETAIETFEQSQKKER